MNVPFDFKSIKALLHKSNLFYTICTDNQGNYTYINDRYANSFNYISNNLIGKPYHITMHPDDMKICKEAGAKCYANPNQLFPAIIRKHDGKGGYIFTQWEFTLMVEDGEPQGVFCVGFDTTQYESIKHEVQTIYRDLEIKKVMLNAIAYEQSHIVRAPLASIMGLVDILKTFNLKPEILEIIDMLDVSSKQLDDVIKEIVNKTNV